MIYKFLDVGCKLAGSFSIANKFGYNVNEGLGVDINENHIEELKKKGFNAVVANATQLPFEKNSFELVIFSHVIEHLPNEELGRKSLEECLRVSSKYVYLALPFFDEDQYLNSLGLKTYYSDWTGHPNMVHLKTITNVYLKKYKYELNMVKKITDSSFPEILPINAPKDSHDYDVKLHGDKKKIIFNRNIWREYTILIKK